MELPIIYPGFEKQHLTVRIGTGVFLQPKLLADGQILQSKKSVFSVTNDLGEVVSIKLRNHFIDPVPGVQIGPNKVELAPLLKWYEYIWIGLPLSFALNGGALGALIGVYAGYLNGVIFRSDRKLAVKYCLTLFIALGGFMVYVILALALRLIILKHL